MTPTATKKPGRAAPSLHHTPAWMWVHSALVFAFLFLPIGTLITYSFSASRYSTVWGGFTTDWYKSLWEDERLMEGLKSSLLLAGGSCLLGIVFGTMAALGHARMRSRRQSTVESLFMLPIMVPDIVIALALQIYFNRLFLENGRGLFMTILGHSILSVSYVFLVVSARLKGFDWRLIEAAKDLGATSWNSFWHVILPLLWPGVLGGALLAFTVSLDELVIAHFLKAPGPGTLPTEIFERVKKGVSPAVNALATILLLGSALLALISALLQRKNRPA